MTQRSAPSLTISAETNAAALCDLIDAALAEERFEEASIHHLRHLAQKNEELLRSYLNDEETLPEI